MSPRCSEQSSLSQIDQQRQYFIYSFVSFLLILILATSLVLISDYLRFEKQFNIDVEKSYTKFNFYIKQNEAVLEGLSAFVTGAGGVNDEMLNRYAKQVNSRFPHIYMLEVAEEVKKSNLKSFIEKQRNKGYTGFDVRAFDYSGNRQWRKLPQRNKYFPLVYIYPLPEKPHKVLGLDLTSHKHLELPLRKALDEGGYQTSLPFNLIEGNKAFVIFKAVESGVDGLSSRYMALIVVTESAFLSDVDVMDNSLGVLVYHNSKTKEDSSGYFIQKELPASKFLPGFTFETKLTPKQSGFILQITKQFQLKDISWILLLIILNLLTTVFYIIKGVLNKNKLMQDKSVKILNQKNKMVAISTLTGGIAHEFNNNLSVVRGFLSLLSDNNKKNKESLAWIEHAETATEKCISLTNELLVYSRYKGIRERLSGIDINDVVSSLSNELADRIKNNITINYNYTEKTSLALINKDDFKEIVFNLVENSVAAIKKEGSIQLSTSKVELLGGEDIESGTDVIAGEYIKFSVLDTGCGIDEEIQMHIFDPYFTTKKFGEGSGMGLAIVYGLVKLNKGYINVESDSDQGSVFNIYLPALSEL